MMVSKGKTSSKGETPLVDLWLNQFERQDRGDAKTLLAAIRNVTANEFLITTQAKRNLSSRSGIGGVRSAT